MADGTHWSVHQTDSMYQVNSMYRTCAGSRVPLPIARRRHRVDRQGTAAWIRLFRAASSEHRSWVERGAQLTDPVDGHGAAVREIVTRLAAPRRDHGQHENPALADQRLIGAGIVRADLD